MHVENAVSGRVTMAQTFEIEKAIAALGFLVQKTGESMYPVLKMMYLADKLHLERFGRFITGDNYCAMAKGPVPSHAYNMIKAVRGDADCRPAGEAAALHFAYTDDHMLRLLREPDLDELSASDMDCLEEVVAIYHRVGKWAIKDMSHDDAWKDAWNRARLTFRKSTSIDVRAIADQFDDADALKAHLDDDSPGEAVLPSRTKAQA